jgi:hypothetical protein
MVHATGVDPTGGAGDETTHPFVLRTLEEQDTYEQEKAECARARAVDEERERVK